MAISASVQQSPASTPSSSAVAMVKLTAISEESLSKAAPVSPAAFAAVDEKQNSALTPLIQPHVIDYLETVFKDVGKKIGDPNVFLNQFEAKLILNLCKTLQVDSKKETVYGYLQYDKKYIGKKGLFDLIATIRSDFASKRTLWKETMHPFIQALDEVKIILEGHIKGFWPRHLHTKGESPKAALDEKGMRLFPSYFILAQHKIFENLTESLGQNLQDGLLLQQEVEAITNLMQELCINQSNKPLEISGSVIYKENTFSGFFGLLALFNFIKEELLQNPHNQWTCGQHPFISVLDEVRKNIYEFMQRTQPQLKLHTEKLERERDQFISLMTRNQLRESTGILACFCCLLTIKLPSCWGWFGMIRQKKGEYDATVISCKDPIFDMRSSAAMIGFYSRVKDKAARIPLDKEIKNVEPIPKVSTIGCSNL